jgi:hypothetical protein
MLDILELGNWLEEIDTAIAIVYGLTSTTLVYVFALTGIKFFSQLNRTHKI